MLTTSHRNHKTVRFLFVDTGNRQTKMQTKQTHDKRIPFPPNTFRPLIRKSCSVTIYKKKTRFTTFWKWTPEVHSSQTHPHKYTFTLTQKRALASALARNDDVREGEAKRKTKKQTESVLLNNIITNLGEEQQKTILLSTLIILETLFNQSHVTTSHIHSHENGTHF